MPHFAHAYSLSGIRISQLTYGLILQHSAAFVTSGKRGFMDIQPLDIQLDQATFHHPTSSIPFPEVVLSQDDEAITLSCACGSPKSKLCDHQVQVLLNVLDRPHLRVFFDEKLRLEKIKEVAQTYGLENEPRLDQLFYLEYSRNSLEIKPLMKELFPVSEASQKYLKDQLLPKSLPFVPVEKEVKGDAQHIVVLGKHRHYEHFVVELLEACTTREGKIKPPLVPLEPLDLAAQTESLEEIRFYTAISKFKHPYETGKWEAALPHLKALVKNPRVIGFFYHDSKISDKMTAASLVPVKLRTMPIDLRLSVDLKEKFHEVSAQLVIDEVPYELKNLEVKYDYFILLQGTMYLIDHPDFLRIVDFFNHHYHKLLIHTSKFEEFKRTILDPLEDKVRISYSHIRPATQEQLSETGFDDTRERIIYLSESEEYILITPVMRYGEVEASVLSRRQLYGKDQNGNVFTMERDEEAEVQFTSLLLRQHPTFADQLHLESFYLHRERFLHEEWFLQAFEDWRQLGITVLGFNELKKIPYNLHKPKVSVHVTSGINWFETNLDLSYGKQRVSLQQLHKSLRNKNKFVQLGDGTLGILPQEWLERFQAFFRSGEIAGDLLRTPKNQFTRISELYEEDMLSKEVQQEVAQYHTRLQGFENIASVEVPNELQATLRDYQKQGLSWLRFLDEFNFGGCLADDMGLGKTVQVIAFLLSIKDREPHKPHLIVVPTTLVTNWQNELARFAPSLRVHTLHGHKRNKHTHDFDQYDVILITYGLLLSDIHYLRHYTFHYAILDESQAIKNPDSQRYMAACMLSSRNRLVLTGTPVENNTFDLYGQLSFACPGLLGNKQYFKDIYSVPIDMFGEKKRAKQLQRLVHPFLLRRTKKQVATELPEKTEMVIYCEMGPEQKKLYAATEKELRDYVATKRKEELPQESMYVLKGITQLRQICDSPELVKEAYYGGASAKIEALMEQIETKSSQHKILVFSQFVTMLDLIKKELTTRQIPFEYLTGQTTRRGDKVASFQQNEEIRVFLISLKAGGVGLNLTEADYVYLVDPWWNPAVENQAIDRSYRIGQTKHVVAVRLICPDTIEEKMMALQASKKELANDLIKTDATMLKSLSKEELMELLGGT